jgi:PilZ domain-containing protein
MAGYVLSCGKKLAQWLAYLVGAGTPAATVEDRRQWVRFASGAQIACQTAPKLGQVRFAAKVHDVSFGGIALVADRPLTPGDLLHVELPGAPGCPAQLLACVIQVHAALAGLWTVGCSFIRELSEQELRQLL